MSSHKIIEGWLILAFVGIPLAQSWSVLGVQVTTTSLSFVALLFYWIFEVVIRHRRWHELMPSPPARGFEWLLLAFVASCAVSLVWAHSLLFWGKEMAQILLSIAIYTMVRSSALRWMTAKQYWLIMLGLTGIATALLWVAGALTLWTGWEYLKGAWPSLAGNGT